MLNAQMVHFRDIFKIEIIFFTPYKKTTTIFQKVYLILHII